MCVRFRDAEPDAQPCVSILFAHEAFFPKLRMSQDLTRLNRTVWNREMTGHRFLGDGTSRQQSRFADGTAVTVDFAENWYKIELSDGETLCGQGLPYEKNAE